MFYSSEFEQQILMQRRLGNGELNLWEIDFQLRHSTVLFVFYRPQIHNFKKIHSNLP